MQSGSYIDLQTTVHLSSLIHSEFLQVPLFMDLIYNIQLEFRSIDGVTRRD